MARRAWPRPWESTRGLTASISVITKEQRKRVGTGPPSKWQEPAWGFYDSVPEVGHAARYKANGLARCNFFVGTRETPEDALQPIDPKAKGVEKDLSGALERVRGRDGTFASLARSYGIQQFMVGESYLVGTEGIDAETWEMLSPQEIRRLTNGGFERSTVDGEGNPGAPEPLQDDSFVLRMWQRHPKIRELPDSSMRGVLDICVALEVATATMTAVDRARLVLNGLLLLPSEAELPPVPGSEDNGGRRRLQLLDDIFEAASAIMEDPGSPPIPIFAEMKSSEIEKVKHLTFDRAVDERAMDKVTGLIRRFAQGIDLPIEIVTGMGGINHWGGWAVQQEANVAYIGPVAAQFCEDLTAGLLLPHMEELKIAHEDQWQYAVGFDMSPLTVNPNRFADTLSMFDRPGVITAEYLRDVAGVPETAKPDDTETKERVEIAQGTYGAPAPPAAPSPSAAAAKPGAKPGAEDQPVEAPGQGVAAEPGPPGSDKKNPPPPGTAASITAMTRIGRVVGAADMAMERAMERAGARIRTRAAKRQDLCAILDGRDNPVLAATLGPTQVESLGLSNDVLLDGAWTALSPRLAAWIGRDATITVLHDLDRLARQKLWDPEVEIVAPMTKATAAAVQGG